MVGAWCNAYNKREKVARVTTKQQQKKEGASFSNVIAWALPVFSAGARGSMLTQFNNKQTGGLLQHCDCLGFTCLQRQRQR